MNENRKSAIVIIVEDNQGTQFLMNSVLQDVAKKANLQITIKTCSNHEDAHKLIAEVEPTVISVDMGFPSTRDEDIRTWDALNGIILIRELTAMRVIFPIITHSSVSAKEIMRELPCFPSDWITLKKGPAGTKEWAEKIIEIIHQQNYH